MNGCEQARIRRLEGQVTAIMDTGIRMVPIHIMERQILHEPYFLLITMVEIMAEQRGQAKPFH